MKGPADGTRTGKADKRGGWSIDFSQATHKSSVGLYPLDFTSPSLRLLGFKMVNV